jgi:uncharacterized membrane protein
MTNLLKTTWLIVRYLLALVIILGGLQHFINTSFYFPFVPNFLPYKQVIIYLSGIIEIVLGVSLLMNKKYAKFGALGVFVAMLVFLPIHISDVFLTNPAIGTHKAAVIRLPIQFLLIGLAYKTYIDLIKKRNY